MNIWIAVLNSINMRFEIHNIFYHVYPQLEHLKVLPIFLLASPNIATEPARSTVPIPDIFGDPQVGHLGV